MGFRHQPANESFAHYALKQAAVAWLRVRKNCWPIGQEVPFGIHVVDVLGLKADRRGIPVWPGEHVWRFLVYAVQVKVSRADARRRWRVPANVLYLMTPPGLLDPSELPHGVGLLEADPHAVRVRCNSYGMPIEISGVRCVRGARVVPEPEGAIPVWRVSLDMAKSFASRMLRGLPLAEWG